MHPGFKPQRACLLPPQCFIYLLGLQGVQWVQELIVVRASWHGHLELYKKKKVYRFCEARKKTIELEEGDCNIYQ
jgi:hypothetical protein